MTDPKEYRRISVLGTIGVAGGPQSDFGSRLKGRMTIGVCHDCASI